VSKIIGVTDTHPRVGQYQNIVTNRFPLRRARSSFASVMQGDA
jgi:hypothetical protein